MKIIIVGLGIMGGSMAKALSFSGSHEILAVEKDKASLNAAIEGGVVKRQAKDNDFLNAHVIYLCLYPENVVEFLCKKAPLIGKSTVVTDICGIKSEIHPRLSLVAKEYGFTYFGSHPMAGREKNSYFASDSSLFLGASYILISGGEKCGLLENLAIEMGFGGIKYVSCKEHDSIIAFTSQLPHVISCAYVKNPNCAKHQGFSAGSFRDMSRVADINAKLWSELFLMNREALLEEINIFKKGIEEIEEAVEKNDSQSLLKLLEKSRSIKRTC